MSVNRASHLTRWQRDRRDPSPLPNLPTRFLSVKDCDRTEEDELLVVSTRRSATRNGDATRNKVRASEEKEMNISEKSALVLTRNIYYTYQTSGKQGIKCACWNIALYVYLQREMNLDSQSFIRSSFFPIPFYLKSAEIVLTI